MGGYPWLKRRIKLPAVGADIDAFAYLLDQLDAELPLPGEEPGLVDDFAGLASDAFDPGAVDPIIRDFYLHTTQFEMEAAVQWQMPLLAPIFSALSATFLQFNPGGRRRDDWVPMKSQFAFWPAGAGDGKNVARVWKRTIGKDRREFYTACIRVQKVPWKSNTMATCLHAMVPFFFGHLAVVLEAQNLDGRGMALTSQRSSAKSDAAGLWAVLVAGERVIAFRPPPIAEGERLELNVDRSSPTKPIIRGRQKVFFVGGRVMFEISYRIRPPAGYIDPGV